jgi:hypothetical protein
MAAFLFTMALVTCFGIVGLGVLSMFPPRIRALQAALISPAVGVATILIPVFWLNRLGLPVKDFAYILAPLLTAGSGISIYAWGKTPWRTVGWFALIALLGLALSGWPMFLYGFDWVSYANDDMANYCLGAQRFLNSGYYDLPDTQTYLAGKDYSQAFWFMHVGNGARSGSELILAAVWGATSLNAHQIFMPVILALHISLICAGAAMTVRSSRAIKAPLIACALLAISPLTTLGAIYQLIGQVGGLMLLCASVTLLCRRRHTASMYRLVPSSIAAAITCSAQFIWYPESLPFLGLGWLVYILTHRMRSGSSAKRIFASAATVGCLMAPLLGNYLVTGVRFMFAQAASALGTSISDPANVFVLFPYYLIPSGIPTALGLMRVAAEVPEPLLSVLIFIGIGVLFWIVWVVIARVRLNDVAASVSVVVLGLIILLFIRREDFGLYKAAMYGQPFFIACLAGYVALSGFLSSQIKVVSLILFATANIITQASYVFVSTGEISGGFVEVPHATRKKLNAHFNETVKNEVGLSDVIISDTSNPVLAKFQGLYTQGKALFFPSRNFMSSVEGVNKERRKREPQIASYIDEYLAARPRYIHRSAFVYGEQKNGFFSNIDSSKTGDNMVLISNVDQAIFNRKGRFYGMEEALTARRRPKNMLIFVDSDLGHHYYSSHRSRAAFYQLEMDPMARQEEFSALGRRQLFLILGATERPRMVVDVTATVLKQFSGALPHPVVRGRGEAAVEFVGHGSGRVVSEPLDPQIIDGLAYVELDFGRDAKRFPDDRTALMLLYGRDIPLDGRRLTVFGKGIYLISEKEYRALDAPAIVKKFPWDLANNALEYSGVYEDGWISERAFFMLTPKGNSRFLTVKGVVPAIDAKDFRTTLTVAIDGAKVLEQDLGLGDFEARAPVKPDGRRHRVELSFDKYQILPLNDERPVGARLYRVGYEGYSSETPPDSLSEFPRDRQELDYAGVYEDGWVSERSFFVLGAKPSSRALVLRGTIPVIEETEAPGSVSISIDGARIHNQQLDAGAFEVRAPAIVAPGPHMIEVAFDGHQVLPGGDGRKVSARVDYIGYSDDAAGGIGSAVSEEAQAP